MTGPEIIEACKGQLYEAWREYRTRPLGDDLAVFAFEKGEGEIQLILAPREHLIEQLSTEGVDFSPYPEIRTRASENNPMPAIGIWVVIGQEEAGKRTIFVTRFIEPLFGRIGGGVRVGQA